MDRTNLLTIIQNCGIEELKSVRQLNELSGAFVNLECLLPNGAIAKILDDRKTYLGNQVECVGSDRCYGVAADEGQVAVFRYGCGGKNAELVRWIKVA